MRLLVGIFLLLLPISVSAQYYGRSTTIYYHSTSNYGDYCGGPTSLDGTGEFFLVPVIDRKRPAFTADSFATCASGYYRLAMRRHGGWSVNYYDYLSNAVYYYTEAIGWQDSAITRYNLAAALYQLGFFSEALQHLYRANHLSPDQRTDRLINGLIKNIEHKRLVIIKR